MVFWCGGLFAAVLWLINVWGTEANTAIALRQWERCVRAAMSIPEEPVDLTGKLAIADSCRVAILYRRSIVRMAIPFAPIGRVSIHQAPGEVVLPRREELTVLALHREQDLRPSERVHAEGQRVD